MALLKSRRMWKEMVNEQPHTCVTITQQSRSEPTNRNWFNGVQINSFEETAAVTIHSDSSVAAIEGRTCIAARLVVCSAPHRTYVDAG